jgi:hypothetical protein
MIAHITGMNNLKKIKQVNTPSNIGGLLNRLQTLSGRPKYRWKDNIKIDVEGMDWENVNRVNLVLTIGGRVA